ncbi:MAG: hypothetical protein RSG53_09005, partial [Oscillospiraceae bacterium]
ARFSFTHQAQVFAMLKTCAFAMQDKPCRPPEFQLTRYSRQKNEDVWFQSPKLQSPKSKAAKSKAAKPKAAKPQSPKAQIPATE